MTDSSKLFYCNHQSKQSLARFSGLSQHQVLFKEPRCKLLVNTQLIKVNNHIDDIRSSHVAPVSLLLLFVEGASIYIGAFSCLLDMLTYQNYASAWGK